MKYLYLWRGGKNNYPDLCLDKMHEADSKHWKELGPFKSDKKAKSAWVLLGRNTGLLIKRGDFWYINLFGIKL